MTDKDLIKQWAKHPVLLSESNRESYFLKRVFEDFPKAKQIIEDLDNLALQRGGSFEIQFADSKLSRNEFEADTIMLGLDADFDTMLWDLIGDYVDDSDLDGLYKDDSDYDREYGYGQGWTRDDDVYEQAVQNAFEELVEQFGQSLMDSYKRPKDYIIDDTSFCVAMTEGPIEFSVVLKILVEDLDI